MVTTRVRSLVWFVAGALIAAAGTVMLVEAWQVDAAPGDTDATLVPITPCRLVDTRQAGQSPLGSGETRTITAHGTNGPIPGSQCTIPADAVGLSMNVTALAATAETFWTIWPNGAAQPEASSLNPAPGQPPTPNAVTTPISTAGRFDVFNFAGTADMLIDVNGYYTRTSLQELNSRLAAFEGVQPPGAQPQSFAATASATNVVTLTETPTAQVSVAVSAPAGVAGQVTLNSTAIVTHSNNDSVLCAIAESTAVPAALNSRDVPSTHSAVGDNGTSVSGTRTFDIAAGATVTYVLACEEFSTDGGSIFARNLTAIFTPAP